MICDGCAVARCPVRAGARSAAATASAARPGGTSTIALVGNPNTGKSTLFNQLTGLHQRTANWSGVTVGATEGEFGWQGQRFRLVDLPGTYSLVPSGRAETIARDAIAFGDADVVLVVMDAGMLERNLALPLQVREITGRVVVCANMMDEAGRAGLEIDLEHLRRELGVPVVPSIALTGVGLDDLRDALVRVARATDEPPSRVTESLDSLLTSRWLGYPLMFVARMTVMWITITGANYPSQALATALFWGEDRLHDGMMWAAAPWWLDGALVSGLYRGLAWVVAVMLPPMAIFFPLFTLLEDAGYLPRVAFNLDRLFAKAGGSGQQALTTSMGFGCNAAGVTACRIIESPRERLVAILTNAFVPCNGRFPTIMLMASLFVATAFPAWLGSIVGAGTIVATVALGVLATLLVSGALTRTVLRGQPSALILELPPYRRPKVMSVLYRSVVDRTARVLYRAVVVAAPAGLLIWIMGNTEIGGGTLMSQMAGGLDGFGRFLGLDGVILIAFILAIPANEIIIPTILMGYAQAPSMVEFEQFEGLRAYFDGQGWTLLTALSLLIFVVLHHPCSTTLLTIKHETGSWTWTAAAFVIPLGTGLAVLAAFASVWRLVGGG